MKKTFSWRLISIVSLIGLVVVLGCQPPSKINVAEIPAEEGIEVISFPTRDVTGFKDLISGGKDYNAIGQGKLYLPKQASPARQVPLMIILHGSGGTWGGRGARHAEFLAEHGIAALHIDTFANRGLGKNDKYIRRLMKVNMPDQLTDAFAALDYLQSHPLIDGSRIGVMGYSLGGISAIMAAYEDITGSCAKNEQRFALHVPFYAPCIIQPRNTGRTGFPLVGLWGGRDEATLKSRCDRLFNDFRNQSGIVETRWYPDAAHGWNGKRPAKFYKSIPNFAPCDYVIQPDGLVIEKTTGLVSDTDKQFIANSESCVSFGYTIGGHEQTNELANQALLDAIERHMPKRNN